MHIQPQKVEKGFIKRWAKQSLSLILRNPIIWTMIILTMWWVSLLGINSIFKLLLGLWFVLLGLEICCTTDYQKMNLNNIIQAISQASKGWLLQINFKMIFFSFIVVLFLIIDATHKPDPKLVKPFLYDTFWIYGFGMLAISGFGLQILSHPFSQAFDVADRKIVFSQCLKAAQINKEVELFFEIAIIINILVVSLLLPALVIALMPFSCAMIYVAFREIFLGQKENTVEQTEQKPEFAPNLVPAIIPNRDR